MATGFLPFTGDSTGGVFDGFLHKEPTEAVRLNTAVPAELQRIIDKALEKDRELRYRTAADLRTDLKRLKRDSSSGKVQRGSGEASAHGPVAEQATDHRMSSAPAAQASVGLARNRYALLVACVALLAAAFAAYHFWPRSNAQSGTAKISANQRVEQTDELCEAFSRQPLRCIRLPSRRRRASVPDAHIRWQSPTAHQ